jgi:hypothetical protein
MSEHRQRMMAAFESRFVPALRERGFVGAFPHLRRELPERVDYLTVQFSSAGGSFVVELGRTGPDGFTEGPWAALPVEKITAAHLMSDRRRLTPRDLHGGWHGPEWFAFGPRSYDDPEPPKPQQHYDAVADQALKAFVEVGEPWLARDAPLETGASLPRPAGPAPWPFDDAAPEGGGARGRFSPLAGLASLLPWNRPNLRIACLVGGLDPPLHRWEHMRRIVPAMSELVEHLPRATAIRSFQYRPGLSTPLPFGKLPWGEAANRKWTSLYLEAAEPVEFLQTEFWSPSCGTWKKEGKDPELYARLERSEVDQAQAFILAVRRDQLRTPGVATAADAVLDAVAALLPGTKRIVFDRAWNEKRILFAIRQNPLESTGAHRVMEWAQAHPRSQVASFGT